MEESHNRTDSNTNINPSDIQKVIELDEIRKSRGYKPGWTYHQARNKGLLDAYQKLREQEVNNQADSRLLTVELVPKSCWFTNVRSKVTVDEWNMLKRRTSDKARYRCEICNGRGPKWPVECHEIWHYDDDRHIQKLEGLIALCPSCHEVKHMGYANTRGRGQIATRHLANINHWSIEKADEYIKECFEVWEKRSQFEWSLNIDLLKEYGIHCHNLERKSLPFRDNALHDKPENNKQNGSEAIVMENPIENSQSDFLYESLDSMRQKLLDLSTRNGLLDYKFSRTKSIKLTSVCLDDLINVLASGSKISILGVPEPDEKSLIDAGYITVDDSTGEPIKTGNPSAEAWAKHLNMNTQFECKFEQPGEKKIKNLSSLMFPGVLAKRLRDIRTQAERAIEDAGANILFLALGFLEWYENDSSKKKRMAPLFNLPVIVTRDHKPDKTGAFPYRIQLKDDDLISNETLKKKLNKDFGLGLPEIQDDWEPESYFGEVEEMLSAHKPAWRVHRNIVLGLFNFTKQAMYAELSPEKWPAGCKLDEHKVISHLFGGNTMDITQQAMGEQVNHEIDRIDNIYETFPIIYDADSSQHSALIDAVKGENLVIIGPPGTGKSQTITNLIAALIANRKKVLFVAEKMSALNVVKERLDKAGLGDFCLELHSHKTSKQKVFSDLGDRLAKQGSYIKPEKITENIAQYEYYKSKLNNYVILINRKWKETGFSIHSILTKSVRLQQQLKINPEEFSLSEMEKNDFSSIGIKRLLDRSILLEDIYNQVAEQADQGCISRHFWYGVNCTEWNGAKRQQFILLLKEWNTDLVFLKGQWHEATKKMGVCHQNDIAIERIYDLNKKLHQLPSSSNAPLSLLPELRQQSDDLESWLQSYEKIRASLIALRSCIKEPLILNPETSNVLNQIEEYCKILGINAQTSLRLFMLAIHDLSILDKKSCDIKQRLEKVKEHTPDELKACFNLSDTGIKKFKQLIHLVNTLPDAYWSYRNDLFDNPAIDPLLEHLTAKLAVLQPEHEELGKFFMMEQLPDYNKLTQMYAKYMNGGLFKWFSSEWKMVKREIMALRASPDITISGMIVRLPGLISYIEGMAALSTRIQQDQLLADFYCGVTTPVERLNTIRGWYKQVRETYGVGFMEGAEMGNVLVNLDFSIVQAIKSSARKEIGPLLNEMVEKREELQNVIGLLGSDQSGSVNLDEQIRTVCKQCIQLSELINNVTCEYDQSFALLLSKRTVIQTLQDDVNCWKQHPLTLAFNKAGYFDRFDLTNTAEEHLSSARVLLSILRTIHSEPLLEQSLLQNPAESHYDNVRAIRFRLDKAIEQEQDSRALFMTGGDVDERLWLSETQGMLQGLVSRNEKALANPDWLPVWINYVQLKEKLSAEGMALIIKKLEQNEMSISNITNVVDLAIHYKMSKDIFEQTPELKKFSGTEQEAIRRKFREYDSKIIAQQRHLVASQADKVKLDKGNSSGRVRDYTELALIRHNLSLKKPRIAIRTLMDRAGASIANLKPCFMMSPMSVAQYLTPGNFNFDVVIMDEASQIRPEEALGAIARGKQIVVVGDPKQLPPSDFFNTQYQETEDEESTAIEQTRSILEVFEPVFKKRLLSWHYRSKHQSLIDFSNQRFYDGKLTVFPSPFKEDPAYGIDYCRVNGWFENKKNREEAQCIVERLVNQLKDYPDDSIGIVAMNVVQRDEILNQIELLRRQKPELIPLFNKNEQSDSPLFVRNLENVQGDERDVIIISMTYGPSTQGGTTFDKNFGPINKEGGWRRLNVLFTRAKKKMLVFSSMDSGLIKTDNKSPGGVIELRNWLKYCETGSLVTFTHTGRAPDSDFEISVMEALADHGYECEPQLGVAGYFLDIAVRHPAEPGRFIMAIECDGATYHSAESARERDRLRQDVLEGLGWKIRRIWSTDWFDNPGACLQPILNELQRER